MLAISILVAAIAVVVTIPSAILLVEVTSAVYFSRQGKSHEDTPFTGRMYILIPAHNESKNIIKTLRDAKAELRLGDRLIVIADNCTDDTEQLALSEHVEVIRRMEPNFQGKGYALAFGFDFIRSDPPATVVILDADCRVAPGSLRLLASQSKSLNRPTQALDLMVSPQEDRQDLAAATFAWIVKNQIRPLGLLGLGCPCQLAGTGMAIPWPALAQMEIRRDELAEDLKLGIDLAIAGYPSHFCPGAVITSFFPRSREAAVSQRRRWEFGTFSVQLRSQIPLLRAAWVQRRVDLLMLAADLTIPPLILYFGLMVFSLLTAMCAALYRLSNFPLIIAGVGCAAFLLSISMSWLHFGRQALPLEKWPGLLSHVLMKVRIYAVIFSRHQRVWRRTDRDS